MAATNDVKSAQKVSSALHQFDKDVDEVVDGYYVEGYSIEK